MGSQSYLSLSSYGVVPHRKKKITSTGLRRDLVRIEGLPGLREVKGIPADTI